ncbi:MAG: enoyl-CoA hydratase-related protein [Woeseiaceae bacterium]|nr:enoyl-CoA hydratase-related protein [Woeseiaceae bacterium]
MIEQQRDDAWLTVWLDRPDTRNALSTEMVDALAKCLDEARADETLRGLTIRGRGGVFCAGGDLKMFSDVFQGDADRSRVEHMSRQAGELLTVLASMPVPVIAAVDGAAMAGGLGMACAADFVVSTRDARFALTETRLGIPPAQIAPYVVRRTGMAAARRIMLAATRFDAAHAQALGIVDQLADDAGGLDRMVADLRNELLQCAPNATRVTKGLLDRLDAPEGDEFIDVAARAFADCLLSDEGREGIASFIGKRAPAWVPGGTD